MRKLLVLAALAATALVPLACDFEKTAQQIQADQVIVATLLATPPVTVSALDALEGELDAGIDAGLVDLGDAGTHTLPGQTAAYVFFGTRKSQSLEVEPDPISNATVTLTARGGTAVTLQNEGAGKYTLVGEGDGGLTYESGRDYEFAATVDGERYVAVVEDSPALEQIPELHPSSGVVRLNAGDSLTLTRPPPPEGQERNLGFVTVFPVSDDGQKGQPTYTNVPDGPVDLLKLVALPREWRSERITVPGTAFPTSGSTYVVVMQAVKLGHPESDNLFTGSALLAGTAEVGIVRTR